MDIGANSGAISAVFGSLFIFGLIYNAFISWANRRGYIEGYTWLTVVIGTAVTLFGAAFIFGLQAALILFALFAASGLPMALGDIARHVRARRRAENDAQRN